MPTLQLRNGRNIGSNTPTYIIAELNTSHFGSLEVACKLIDSVKDSGADCVKFQSWSDTSLYSENFYRENPMAKRFMTKFALSDQELKYLRDYAVGNDLDFASTPYSHNEADFLVNQCDVPFIKVASMDLNNLIFLKDIAQMGVPIFLSTGMGEVNEINAALKVITDHGNSQIVILHCVSLYPTPDPLLNLNNIIGLRREFGDFLIGYSDHSLGDLATFAAVALGSSVIEKHVTLDSKKIGLDNQMAMEFLDFRNMILGVRRLEQMLGKTERSLSSAEMNKSLEMRRSITARRDLLEGEVLTLEKIDFKRPGTGIPLKHLHSILGKRVKSKIPRDFLVTWDDLE